MASSNSIGAFSLDNVVVRKPIKFPDGTIQSTAYEGAGGVPTLEEVLTAGSDANGLSITGVDDLVIESSGLAKYDAADTRVIPSIPALSGLSVPSFEILTDKVTGGAGASGQIIKNITLTRNLTATTNYAVFASVYYGFTGSGGTYNAIATSGALNPVVISAITPTQFTYNVVRGTGDNLDVYFTFLVVYQAEGTNYPKVYS